MLPRTGPDGALEFFKVIGAWTPHRFEVLALMEGGDRVAAEVEAEFTVASGRRFSDQEMHLWTFNGEGKVSSFRHYLDTAKHIEVAAD
jgi:ketosteroid isomerase-like protein